MKYAFLANVNKETKKEVIITLEIMGIKEYLFSDVALDLWGNVLPGYYGFYIAEEADDRKLNFFLRMISISINRFRELEFKEKELPPEGYVHADQFH